MALSLLYLFEKPISFNHFLIFSFPCNAILYASLVLVFDVEILIFATLNPCFIRILLSCLAKSLLVVVISIVGYLSIPGFLETKNSNVETITFAEFKNYTDKTKLKNLVKKHDFFIAQASLMPKVATTFGRVLGPAGKMPSPQLGILLNVSDKDVVALKDKIDKSIKLRVKEASIKLAVGKQSMKDEEIIENILAVYNTMLKTLPKQKENIKNLAIKLTMTKPIKISIK